MSLDNSDDDDNISVLQDGLDLKDIVSEKGGTFCITNVINEEKDSYIYANNIPFDVLKRPEIFKEKESILGLGFEEISKQFVSLTDDSGIKKNVIKEGEGSIITADSYFTVHYDCYLEYGDEPIDSSRCRKKPMSFKLGNFETIEGFEIAIKSMRKKEISAFLISPNYAFGEYGCPPRIPPNASFLYLIELLFFEDVQDEYYRLSPSQRVKAPLEIMKKAALKFHKRGRELFKEKRFLQATRIYQKELEILESYHLKDEEEENKVKEILKSLYENLALCYLKILRSVKCITYSNLAMEIKGETSKLLYVKGKALRQLGKFSLAKKLLLKALEILPENAREHKDIELEINKLDKKWKLMVDFLDDAYSDLKTSETNSTTLSYEKNFEQNLKIFKSDKDLIELPLSCKLYSNEKLAKIKDIILQNNLKYIDCTNEEGEAELHIVKTSADLFDDQQLEFLK